MPPRYLPLALALALLCGLASAAFNPSCTAQDIDVNSVGLGDNDFCSLLATCATKGDDYKIPLNAFVTITNKNNANRYCITLWPCFGTTPDKAIHLVDQVTGRTPTPQEFPDAVIELSCKEFKQIIGRANSSGVSCTDPYVTRVLYRRCECSSTLASASPF